MQGNNDSNSGITIQFGEQIDSSISNHLQEQLKLYNESNVGKYARTPFIIYLKQANEKIIGGLTGRLVGNRAYIEILWVDKHYRNKGLGHQLMTRLENFLKQKSCQSIQVDTAEFQAKGFYEALGYQLIAELPKSYLGYDSYILEKKIA